MQVTRQRRKVPGVDLGLANWAGRRLRIVVAATAAFLAVGGGMAAFGSTVMFGDNQVGTQYSNWIQVSDDQIINPIGDRLLTQFGKFMGSTVSPDGHFLAATSADKSVVLQIFDLSSYKLIWTVGTASGVNQTLSDGTVGQEGPTYSPDGKFLWLPEQDALTRFPVNSDGTLGAPTRFALPTVGSHLSGNSRTPTPDSALVGQTTYSPDGSRIVRCRRKGHGAGSVSRLVRADGWWRIPIGHGHFAAGDHIGVLSAGSAVPESRVSP